VKPGTYRIGGWKRSEASANITLRPYWIARYPVTVAQYRAFIDAGGYAHDEYWTPHGRTWKRERNRTRPWGWYEPQYTGANQPVIGVTWYEAAAFCNWLNAHLRAALPEEYALRLPTEAEWEVAAAYDAAGQRRDYPWGWEDPTPERAIYNANGLNAPAPVGCCPAGAAACGALDMAGNVWEVTTSRYGQYPAGSAWWEKDVPPVGGDVPWRGGAWWNDSTFVRCGARNWYFPFGGRIDDGFRLVVAPHSH
jgi:formylglycine-generating enzyme required for sulfatase activity